jgi:spermidine synthase
MHSVIVFGVTSIVFQLLFFREFLGSVTGNELTVSLLLFLWLALNGLGAIVGGKVRAGPALQKGLHGLAIALPFLILILLRATRNLVFTAGQEPDIFPFLAYAMFLLAPFCLLNGLFIPVVYGIYRRAGRPAPVYIADNIGDMAGGLLFSLFLIRMPDPFLVFLITGGLNLFSLVRLKGNRLLLLCAAALLLLSPFLDLNRRTSAFLFPGLRLEKQVNSKYGLIRLFTRGDERIIMENSDVVAYADNVVLREELTHFPLIQHENVRRVLVVSGGLSGVLEEVRKYGPDSIDYVERDPEIIRAGRAARFLPEPTADVNEILMDGREYVEHTDRRYDAILLCLPPPETLKDNRFYTAEFFGALKKRLNARGVAAFTLPGIAGYIGPETREILGTLKATLKGHFSHVMFYPGTHTIVVASDAPLARDLASLPPPPGIQTKFFNQDYLKGYLTPFRMEMVNRQPGLRINRDFRPVLFLVFQKVYLKEFGFRWALLFVPLAVLFAFFFMLRDWKPFAVFSTGLAVTAAEIFFFTAFEIYYGTLFYALSFMVTVFLAGLSLGYFAGTKTGAIGPLLNEGLIIAFILLAAGVTYTPGKYFILPLLFVLAFLAGLQFVRLLTPTQDQFSRLFGADFLGGALGALIMGTFLFPALGPLFSLLTLAGIKMVSFYVVARKS